MICDKNGVIIKLDGKSVIQFLRENEQPLVIYGAGKKGQFILDAMDKLNIKVSMVVDGDERKQNTIIKGRRIASIEEVKKQYSDALVWITIADAKIRIPLEKKIHELGFSPIMTFDIEEPMSEQAYIDIEEGYPYFLVGKNKYSIELQEYLKQKNSEIIGIENDVSFIEQLHIDLEQINIIICDDTLFMDTVFWLHDQGVFENIYLYIRGDFGVFKIEKYRFLSIKLRYITKALLAALNGMNRQMADEASKKSFQEINYRYIKYIKNKKYVTVQENVYKQLAELRYRIHALNNSFVEDVFYPFDIDLREDIVDIFSYLSFLSKVYECCICYQKKMVIEKKKDNLFKIFQEEKC